MLLGLAAVVAVLLIVWGIRFATKSSGSGDVSTTTIPRSAHNQAYHGLAQPVTHAAPITAAQLDQVRDVGHGPPEG